MSEKNYIPSRLSVLTDSLQFAKAEDNADDDVKSFSGVAYAGGVVKLGWMGAIVVDLSSFKAQPKTPMLFHHDGKQIVGHGKVTVEDGKLTVDGVVYNDDLSPEGQSIVSKQKKGFPWKLSIGWIWETRQFLSKGTKAKVNGKVVKGPVTILSGNVLDEISFTGIPADRNTKVKVAASSDKATTFYMEEDQSNQLKQSGDLGTMENEEKEALEKKITDGTTKITDLEGKLAAKDEETSKLSAKLNGVKEDGRKERLKSLDGKLSEDETAKLMKLDDDSFDFMVDKLSIETPKPKLPKNLTQHVADGDTEGDENGSGEASIDLVAMAKERNKAATAV